ncbi:MAG: DHH family phosphoesterase [Oscillospiraceae bacterium]|jgi:phosphoesterase RecJ-like protein|nr:DHH family phosphoesterase [Oscillospiraceae bacterium]
MTNKLKEISDFLIRKNNFHILTHVNPDGDAVGSALALCFGLIDIGKNSQVICSVPEKFKFLKENFQEIIVGDPEVIICVDTADRNLIVNGDKYSKIDICIDHHVSNSNYSDIVYNDPNVSANTENIYKLLKFMKIEIDAQIAKCIYTGIVCDTGRFKFSNVTSQTFAISSEILPKIDNFENLNRKIFDNKSKNYMAFLGEVIKNCEYYFEDKCALISVSINLMNKFNLIYEEIEEISSIPLKISGIEFGVTIKEKSENFYKVSVRTSNKKALEICKKFGGGGHEDAGGFEISGNFSEIKNKILNEIKKIITNAGQVIFI